jgi:hypothetical protein
MKTEEAKKYEADPDFKIYLQLRRWDEAAKVEADKINVPSVADYLAMMKKYCNDKQTLEKRLAQIPQIELYSKNEKLTIQRMKLMAGFASSPEKLDKKVEKKRAAKCLQLLILFIRVSKVQMKNNAALVPEQGAHLIKALEPLTESSKAMTNLKGKLREIKALVQNA